MRVINYTLGLIFCGFVACGGESDLDNPNEGNGSDAGEGGDTSNPPPSGGGDAGSTEPGAAGKGAAPGTGGTTARGGGAGTPPSMGAVGGGTNPPPPAGGRPNPPPPPIAGAGPVPPDGCLLQSASSGAGYCESYYACGNGMNYLQVVCKDNGTGNGDCYCGGSSVTQQFQVSGTPTFATCDTAAQLCLGGGPEPSEEECTPAFTSSASTSCQLQERCTRSIEGSDATIARTRSVNCSGADPVTCYCDYSGNQFRLDADSSDGACEKVIEHCDDPRVPPEGPVTCEPRSQQSGMGFCSVYEECLSETDIGDGISAVSIEGRNATCQTAASGGSLCTCQGSSVAFQFEIDTPADSLAACLSATDICGGGGELKLDGETECLPSNQSATMTECYAQLDCAKSGTIGDQEVRVHGYLSLSCSAQGDAYTCTCSSNQGSESLQVDGDTAWSACSAAVTQCPALVEPSFEAGSGVGGAGPVPTPGLPAGGRF
jgi:hypothetical protein